MTIEQGDLISREALKKAIEKYKYCGFYDKLIELIDNTPTVEIPVARWDCYCEGQKVGYEKALSEKPQGEWIPVSDRLPDKNIKCLVSLDFGDVNIDAFVDGIFVYYLGNVIAWQPLPEPYQKEIIYHEDS